MAQVALNWCNAKPNVISIPKSDKVECVVENCQASGWRLSTEQLHLWIRPLAKLNGKAIITAGILAGMQSSSR